MLNEPLPLVRMMVESALSPSTISRMEWDAEKFQFRWYQGINNWIEICDLLPSIQQERRSWIEKQQAEMRSLLRQCYHVVELPEVYVLPEDRESETFEHLFGVIWLGFALQFDTLADLTLFKLGVY